VTKRLPLPAFPKLTGTRVHLREICEADLPNWFARASDTSSSDLSGDPIPDSIDTVRGWFELHRDRYASGEGIRWAICTKDTDESIGSIGLSCFEAGGAELGAVIARAYWRQGLGTEAARLVIGFAFDVLKLDVVRADCLARNAASVGVLTRLGFARIRTIERYLHDEPGLAFKLRRGAEQARSAE